MENNFKNNAIAFWLIWFAMFSALFMYQFFLAFGIPSGKNVSEPPVIFMWIIGVSVLVASVIRWVIIPRQKNFQNLLHLMIVGLALSESIQFIQIFIVGKNYPETQLTFFAISILSVEQFIPFYANAKTLQNKQNTHPFKQ